MPKSSKQVKSAFDPFAKVDNKKAAEVLDRLRSGGTTHDGSIPSYRCYVNRSKTGNYGFNVEVIVIGFVGDNPSEPQFEDSELVRWDAKNQSVVYTDKSNNTITASHHSVRDGLIDSDGNMILKLPSVIWITLQSKGNKLPIPGSIGLLDGLYPRKGTGNYLGRVFYNVNTFTVLCTEEDDSIVDKVLRNLQDTKPVIPASEEESASKTTMGGDDSPAVDPYSVIETPSYSQRNRTNVMIPLLPEQAYKRVVEKGWLRPDRGILGKLQPETIHVAFHEPKNGSGKTYLRLDLEMMVILPSGGHDGTDRLLAIRLSIMEWHLNAFGILSAQHLFKLANYLIQNVPIVVVGTVNPIQGKKDAFFMNSDALIVDIPQMLSTIGEPVSVEKALRFRKYSPPLENVDLTKSRLETPRTNVLNLLETKLPVEVLKSLDTVQNGQAIIIANRPLEEIQEKLETDSSAMECSFIPFFLSPDYFEPSRLLLSCVPTEEEEEEEDDDDDEVMTKKKNIGTKRRSNSIVTPELEINEEVSKKKRVESAA